jgi:drug/metabolite transporter (DMT)-like permease
MSANDAWLIVLLGITSTTQTHMAKALERQGIETVDLVRARLRRSGTEIEGKVRKPLIYGVGLVLNHTTFVYHLLVAPLGGTTSLYTSMYGAGLIALLPYTTRVMKERLSRLELVGAVAILLGTLTIGIEGISRPPLDMGQMDLGWTVLAVVVLLGACLVLILVGLRNGTPNAIGLAYGLGAGACGTLDPFLKGVGQTAVAAGRSRPARWEAGSSWPRPF